MRRIVENIGLDWSAQRAKLVEQAAKFSCGDMPTVGADGNAREMLSMPVEKLALWLASDAVALGMRVVGTGGATA